MFEFNKISVNQILVLSETIDESSLMQREFIEGKYLRNAPNFGETVELLQELDLIKVRRNQVVLRPKYKAFLRDFRKSQQPKQIVKELIRNCLLTQQTSFSEYISEFLSNFHFKNEQYEFTPDTSQRMKYSGLRNFLIDLEFLYLDSTEMKYVIAPEYTFVYTELLQSRRLSLDEFLKVQQKRIEIGRAAELQIVEYEKKRLSKFPHLAEKIEHVASRDVMAGYDIRSFDGKLNKSGNCIPRLIEVKAVSSRDYGFDWTRNEIETSKHFRKHYFLYLLPVVGKNQFDLKNLKIIMDPYSNVYQNKKEWVRTHELLAFSLSTYSNK